MKKLKVTDNKKSRRSFFKKGILMGLASILGSAAIAKSTPDKKETVKMLTADGKLVEVEKKFLPPKRRRVVSNRDLFRWKFGKD